MFLDDIFDGKGSDNKSNIFNPAELLQSSWSDGSHQQIFAPPNPSNLLPSVEFNSGSSDRAQPQGFLSKLLPDFDDLPKLPGLPSPGDLRKLPGLPNPGDLIGQLPQLPNIKDLPQPPSLSDLPRIPIPSDRQHGGFPNLAEIVGSTVPFAGPFFRTAFENGQTPEDQWVHRPHQPHHPPHWNPEHGGPVVWPRNPNFGNGHCPDNSGGEEPVVRSPRPVDATGPITGDRDPRNPSDVSMVIPCPIDETGGQDQQGPHYDNVTKREIKDVMDKYFEDIDGSNANGLQEIFGFDKNGHVDSKEIMDFVTKNMDKLSDREIRVLLTASRKEQEISNAYNDEWGAETSGMSRSDIAVWERQQPQKHIPEDEIVFKPYGEDPWMMNPDKRYPLPNVNEREQVPNRNGSVWT